MHEHHLAKDIIISVENLMRANGWRKVKRVVVQVRQPSAVVEESLRHGFDELKKDSLLPEAELFIEEAPLLISCKRCGAKFESRGLPDSCRGCGSPALRLEQSDGISLGPIECEA